MSKPGAVQTYLSAEMNAENTLTTTTNGDALTDTTSLADAQFTWTQSSDAATEGYLYSVGKVDDNQSDDDALSAFGRSPLGSPP